MNRKASRLNVALQIGTESPSKHHLKEYLLVHFYLLRLQMVLGSPKLFLFILERGFICPPSSVFSPQGAQATASGQGDPPWIALAGGINSNTPSVRDDGMVVSGGGGGIPFTVPVTGMYFVHSDHLGSVSFLTNGRGAIIAGGEFGGKSDIQYKPYGEIDRPHSSGPDISKYKYTGQEEDKESGLLYYKARYYDPGLGRFLQADDMAITDEPFGVNRYMYVGGDPVSLADSNGNVCTANIVGAIAFNLMGPVGTAAFGVAGNHTGGGSCSKLPNEKGLIRLLGFLRSDQIENETERSIFLYMVDHYAESLNGVGPSPIGKLNRTELKIFLLFEYLQTGKDIGYYILAYQWMTTGVLRARSSVDQASIYHDQYGPNVLRPQNRRANSKWMGQAKTASFSHDTWSRNYKREWNATKRSCRDARDLCATVNALGTTVADAVMTITGSVLFSIANVVTGVATIPKARYSIRGARFNGNPFSNGHSI